MRGKPEPAIVRFWRFVTKTDGCWIWNGAVTAFGYGAFKVGAKRVSAHRFSYEVANGPIPYGAWVLHGPCNNPRCVRPDHLYLGDRAKNMKDAHERGTIDLSRVASFPRPGRQA